MNQYKIDFNSMDWDIPTAGVRQKVVVQGATQFRLLEFLDDFVELDWCTKGHIGYVIDGQLEIDFSGTSILFGPGDGVTIPEGADHKHKAKSVTDKVTIFVVEST
jgi:ethanolamine utilization protein EutQ (cupin superfamily)